VRGERGEWVSKLGWVTEGLAIRTPSSPRRMPLRRHLSLQLTYGLGVSIKPLPPVLTLGRSLEPVHHAAVGGKPGIPIVGGGGCAGGQGAAGQGNAAFVGGTYGPALGHAVGTFALVAAIHINPEGGSVVLDGSRGAGGLAALAADALAGNGVGHGFVRVRGEE
jgi:hypothetical protein